MGVFTASPKSFKVDRKSRFASKLKSLIFDNLCHFCPDYADDVLAEYITVLICNGKNQNQAREDLEAFLGEKSEEFISWLWNILLGYEASLSANIPSKLKEKTSGNFCETSKENDNGNGKSMGLQRQGNSEFNKLMSKAGAEIYDLTAKSCKPGYVHHPEEHHSLPAKETISRITQSSGLGSKSANINSSAMEDLSLSEYQSGRVDNSKAIKRPSSLPRRHPGSLPKSGPIASTRSAREHPQMHCKVAAPVRSTSPLPLVAASHNRMPRKSVWDRLGKPPERVPSRGQTADCDLMENTCITRECIGQRPPMLHKHDKQIVRVSTSLPTHGDHYANKVGEVHQIVGDGGADKINGCKGANDVVETMSQAPSVGNIRRKRHFGDLASQSNDDAAVEGVLQARKRPEITLDPSQVVDSVHDVKLRLRRVEIEMAKLRSKQAEMENDGKTKSLMNHGVLKTTEEDTDSKTILVTNVHCKATKEALSMYFGKCGAVVNVIMLTDSNPFAPQKSAYITFGSKESADRALGFSGTTFYSRTILVSRKGAKAIATSAKLAVGRSQVHVSQPKGSVTPNKSAFTRSHLQWRRESLTFTKTETLASNVEQLKVVTGSASQQKSPAASVSEQYGDSKLCPPVSADQPSEAET